MSSPVMDKRRRQWQPIAVSVPYGKTGKALKARFGRDGLLVWILYLLACKTNWIQGQFSYSSEVDGWTKLGLYGMEPDFTLESFFKVTGQLKQTSRRRSGDLSDIVCTNWEAWAQEIKRERDAERNSRKPPPNTADIGRENGGDTAEIRATDVDVDLDVELTPPTPPFENGSNQCSVCGVVAGKTELRLAEHMANVHDDWALLKKLEAA